MFQPEDIQSRVVSFRVVNDGPDEAPPYGAMKVVSTDTTTGLVTVERPGADGIAAHMIVINGPAPIPAGAEGYASKHAWERIKYKTADGTPAVGESWGTEEDSWELSKGKGGFASWGGNTEGTGAFTRVLGSPCGDPGEPPEDWEASDPACYKDDIEGRCEDEVQEFRRVRVFLTPSGFVAWYGPWGTDPNPAEP